MSGKNFDIQKYLADGVENIVKDAISATFKNPKETLFLAKFARSSRKATKIRTEYSKKGINIPAFLIASITSSCNLHCAGCYSRANNICSDNAPQNQLTDKEWEDIFRQSRDLGINFIVLAGGEPMLRWDVILKASKYSEIMFPIFTNGTMLNSDYFKLIDKHRNLVPVLSIEGNQKITNSRRGDGVYEKLIDSMNIMREKNLIFGASITITQDNISYALSDEFVTRLYELGCKVLFFIEFIPIDESAKNLAPSDKQRQQLMDEIITLREKYPEMLFMSFPGDEKESGGCLAAGRGFFHINSHGGAEPCPASPYSDINVKDTSILKALQSNLFKSLQDADILTDSNSGGCVLFENKEKVEEILKS